MQLAHIEAAFKSVKSELDIRLLYHQLGPSRRGKSPPAVVSTLDAITKRAIRGLGNFRESESVRDTKRKLMPCLKVHSGQNGVGNLGDTEVDG